MSTGENQIEQQVQKEKPSKVRLVCQVCESHDYCALSISPFALSLPSVSKNGPVVLIAAGDGSGNLSVYAVDDCHRNISFGRVFSFGKAHGQFCRTIHWDPNPENRRFFIGSGDGTVSVWRVKEDHASSTSSSSSLTSLQQEKEKQEEEEEQKEKKKKEKKEPTSDEQQVMSITCCSAKAARRALREAAKKKKKSSASSDDVASAVNALLDNASKYEQNATSSDSEEERQEQMRKSALTAEKTSFEKSDDRIEVECLTPKHVNFSSGSSAVKGFTYDSQLDRILAGTLDGHVKMAFVDEMIAEAGGGDNSNKNKGISKCVHVVAKTGGWTQYASQYVQPDKKLDIGAAVSDHGPGVLWMDFSQDTFAGSENNNNNNNTRQQRQQHPEMTKDNYEVFKTPLGYPEQEQQEDPVKERLSKAAGKEAFVCLFSPHSSNSDRHPVLLATGNAGKHISLFDAASKKLVKMLEGHRSRIFSLDWSKRGNLLWSVCEAGQLRGWKIDRDHPENSCPLEEQAVKLVGGSRAVSVDQRKSQFVVAACGNNGIKMFCSDVFEQRVPVFLLREKTKPGTVWNKCFEIYNLMPLVAQFLA